jgi:hypothetical protein
VQHLLGHKSLEQTMTYLNVTLTGLEESMRRFDESVARCKPIPADHQPTTDERGVAGFAVN